MSSRFSTDDLRKMGGEDGRIRKYLLKAQFVPFFFSSYWSPLHLPLHGGQRNGYFL